MKAVLFPVILAVSAAGGVLAADFVRGTVAPTSAKAGSHGAEGGDHGDAMGAVDEKGGHGDKGKKAKASKGHDDKGYAGGGDEIEFIKFKRQFVVPVLANDDVQALILLNIGLEVPGDKREDMFRLEPRFRDAFIRELLQLSDAGYFDSELTSPDTYEVLRETLARAAREISDDGISDVLILDLSRQDR